MFVRFTLTIIRILGQASQPLYLQPNYRPLYTVDHRTLTFSFFV